MREREISSVLIYIFSSHIPRLLSRPARLHVATCGMLCVVMVAAAECRQCQCLVLACSISGPFLTTVENFCALFFFVTRQEETYVECLLFQPKTCSPPPPPPPPP